MAPVKHVTPTALPALLLKTPTVLLVNQVSSYNHQQKDKPSPLPVLLIVLMDTIKTQQITSVKHVTPNVLCVQEQKVPPALLVLLVIIYNQKVQPLARMNVLLDIMLILLLINV